MEGKILGVNDYPCVWVVVFVRRSFVLNETSEYRHCFLSEEEAIGYMLSSMRERTMNECVNECVNELSGNSARISTNDWECVWTIEKYVKQ